MIALKYIHDIPTRIRKEYGGEKFDIKKGENIEVEKKVADDILAVYPKYFEIVGEKTEKTPKKQEISKKPAQKEEKKTSSSKK